MKLVYNDASHTYTLNGKRVKSASKVAGIAADKFTVEQWGKRMVAIGMTLRPDLIERVAVDLDNKTAIQEVCGEAHTAAKGNARAERGTQRHRVLELSLLGQHDQFITPQQLADAEVLARTLDAYRLEPVPGYVEQFIAYPDHGVVGRFDAVLRRDGTPALYDLKGGENAVKYPHSTLTQLALYLFAPNVSARIERDGDRSTVTEWTTMPDGIDTDTAYVIYCDDHHDVGELWALDMRHGREGADLALRIVDWRKKHRYGDNAVKKIEAAVVLTGACEDCPTGCGECVAAEAPKRTAPTKDDVVARYNGLSQIDQDKFKTERTARNIDNDDVPALWALLDDIFNWAPGERPEPKPRPEPVESAPPAPDDGGPIDEALLGPLGDLYEALSDTASDWFADLVAQGRNGHPWEMRPWTRTVRNFELYRGLLGLANWDEFNADADAFNETILAPLVWAASGYDDSVMFANVTPGVALGSLDAEGARTFSRLVDDLIANRRRVVVDDGSGRWRLEPAA